MQCLIWALQPHRALAIAIVYNQGGSAGKHDEQLVLPTMSVGAARGARRQAIKHEEPFYRKWYLVSFLGESQDAAGIRSLGKFD
jgi:hypothetical protein